MPKQSENEKVSYTPGNGFGAHSKKPSQLNLINGWLFGHCGVVGTRIEAWDDVGNRPLTALPNEEVRILSVTVEAKEKTMSPDVRRAQLRAIAARAKTLAEDLRDIAPALALRLSALASDVNILADEVQSQRSAASVSK